MAEEGAPTGLSADGPSMPKKVGWYRDRDGQRRFWNGVAWTALTDGIRVLTSEPKKPRARPPFRPLSPHETRLSPFLLPQRPRPLLRPQPLLRRPPWSEVWGLFALPSEALLRRPSTWRSSAIRSASLQHPLLNAFFATTPFTSTLSADQRWLLIWPRSSRSQATGCHGIG